MPTRPGRPDALRRLVRGFADPEVAYVCGQLRLQEADGTNREGAYWRYEMWLREQESTLGSVTGGNGSIYALRRVDYVEVDPRFGHDLALPYLMVQRDRRAVYEPEAHAFEKPSRDLEDEYHRKVRMFEHCWLILLEGRMLRDVDPVYLVQLVSHRALRYGSGFLHLVLLVTSLGLARRGPVMQAVLAAQLAGLALAAAGRLRAPIPGSRPRLLLPARDAGDRRRPRALPAIRRPGGLGQGGGNTVSRPLDVVGSAVLLALTSPLVGAAALVVKLEDGGPVLYRQERVGLRGREFVLFKLRTMVVGAERIGAGYAVDAGDPRITRAGRVLRRLSIDELPQLWNVLIGDMALVGPRPTLAYQVERYTPRQRRRLEVKPGITGWAQVNGRTALPWDDRIELDVWYVEHRSLWLDLKILARTPLALFGGTYKGASGGWKPAS